MYRFIFLISCFFLLNISFASEKPPGETEPFHQTASVIRKSTPILMRWNTLPESYRIQFSRERKVDSALKVSLLQAFAIVYQEMPDKSPKAFQAALKLDECPKKFIVPKTTDESIGVFCRAFESTNYWSPIKTYLKEQDISTLQSAVFLKYLFRASHAELDFSTDITAFDIIANFYLQVNRSPFVLKSALTDKARQDMLSGTADDLSSVKMPPSRKTSDADLDGFPSSVSTATTTTPSPLVTYGFIFGGVVVLTAILNPEATGRAVRTLRDWFRG